jgi:hypothetical protein
LVLSTFIYAALHLIFNQYVVYVIMGMTVEVEVWK